MPAGTVKVDRTTRWGNPFRPDECGSAAQAVACHRAWILGDAARLAALGGKAPRGLKPPPVDEIRRELRGKNLACWCPPGTPCHADFLVELANSS
jgi:hypothetical protein